MLLVDPALSAEHSVAALFDKAKTKFRFKPTHLFVIGPTAQGGGTEITSDNVREFLKDGLTVLASTSSRQALDPAAFTTASGSPLTLPADDNGATAAAQVPPMLLAHDGGGSGSHELSAHDDGEHKELHTTDSCGGSCSSDAEISEQQSVKSFDSDSLYSFGGNADSLTHSQHNGHGRSVRSHSDQRNDDGAAQPGLGFGYGSQASGQGHTAVRNKGWKWMLPKSPDQHEQQQPQAQQPQQQQQPQQLGQRPPTHPPPSPPLRPACVILQPPVPVQPVAAVPHSLVAHSHREHRCSPAAASACAASASVSASASASSSVSVSVSSSSAASPSPSVSPLPSIMDEIYSSCASAAQKRSRLCECCEAGCDIVWAPSFIGRAASPARSTPTPLTRCNSSPAPSPSPSESAVAPAASSGSSASSSSAAPPPAPVLSSSVSSSGLDSLRLQDENRRLLSLLSESERKTRRLESSLKAHLKSELDLRAQVALLSAGSTRAASMEEEFRALKMAADVRDKEIAKAAWERDRLRTKNKALMHANNELKSDSEQLAALRKEHAALAQTHARMSGALVDASTPAGVLNDLLLLHSGAISRVHQQMAANIAAEKKELKEARQCKVCMGRPCDTILLPCSHFVLCGSCAGSVTRCPICRQTTHDKRPVYM